VPENAYFERLHELGYAINVYQTDFLDYCASADVAACRTERTAGLGPIARSSLPVGDKAAVIMLSFWALSDFARVAAHFYDAGAAATGLPVLDFDFTRRAGTVNALADFDRLIADLREAQPGEAYFAHILLPHFPYATRPDCSLKGKSEWLSRGSYGATLEERQRAYFDQLGCVTTKVGEALAAVASSPAWERSVVVIHGDHGSRITEWDPTVENVGRFGPADMISGYSTLFAIRAPGIARGYETARSPVADLLASFAGSGFRSAPALESPADRPSVVLDDRNLKPVRRHDLPADWAQRRGG
jgi:hypothetical protein